MKKNILNYFTKIKNSFNPPSNILLILLLILHICLTTLFTYSFVIIILELILSKNYVYYMFVLLFQKKLYFYYTILTNFKEMSEKYLVNNYVKSNIIFFGRFFSKLIFAENILSNGTCLPMSDKYKGKITVASVLYTQESNISNTDKMKVGSILNAQEPSTDKMKVGSILNPQEPSVSSTQEPNISNTQEPSVSSTQNLDPKNAWIRNQPFDTLDVRNGKKENLRGYLFRDTVCYGVEELEEKPHIREKLTREAYNDVLGLSANNRIEPNTVAVLKYYNFQNSPASLEIIGNRKSRIHSGFEKERKLNSMVMGTLLSNESHKRKMENFLLQKLQEQENLIINNY